MFKQNLLIACMPSDVYNKLQPLFETFYVRRGHVLHRPGEEIRDLYFPLDCLISVTITMGEGAIAETGVIGNREVVGINAFMGGRETTQTEYVVQIAGRVIRIAAAPVKREFDQNRGMRDVMLKYTQAYIAQISQNAACNRLHAMEQRYARWLLEARDRIESDELALTQEFISEMLGVRRSGISEISVNFAEQGLISHSRGLTRIVDGGSKKDTHIKAA
jgi:CRP-like cAMP-binding protein